MLRTGSVVATALLAAACSACSPDVSASVRGDNETGRYVATITNDTDADMGSAERDLDTPVSGEPLRAKSEPRSADLSPGLRCGIAGYRG